MRSGFACPTRRRRSPPARFRPSCAAPRSPRTSTVGEHLLRTAKGVVHVAVRPLASDTPQGAELVLVHDMSFIERRSEETRRYLFYFFAALSACVALITVVIAQLSWRGWVAGLRALLRGEGILRPSADTAPELRPIARDVQALLRELEHQFRPTDESQQRWTQETLRAVLRGEMRGNDIIVVSNREPYIHVKTPQGIRVQRPASGLVTALEPVMRACSGTWIAHGSGSGDRETVDKHDRVAVPPEDPQVPDPAPVAVGRGRPPATTTASPTRACGRCATSRTCARRSAPRTGRSTAR